MRGLPNVMVLS